VKKASAKKSVSRHGSPTKSTDLAQKLRKIRLGLGLSQSELLDRLGFSDRLFRSNISQYERGDRTPSPAVLLSYARLANLDLAILIDDELHLPAKLPGNITYRGLKRKPTPRKR
jgi:transcriptional regulator with XRE-family HTH domain